MSIIRLLRAIHVVPNGNGEVVFKTSFPSVYKTVLDSKNVRVT